MQPDLIKVGGFAASKKVAALAEAFGCVCTPHQTQPLGTIANLHFAAATPCCRYSREYNIEPHRIGNALFKNPVPVVDGHIAVSEEPGLGVEIDEEILSRVEQLVTDNEWASALDHILQLGFHVSEETLAADVIERMGIGGNHLAEEHTIRYMRETIGQRRSSARVTGRGGCGLAAST